MSAMTREEARKRLDYIGVSNRVRLLLEDHRGFTEMVLRRRGK